MADKKENKKGADIQLTTIYEFEKHQGRLCVERLTLMKGDTPKFFFNIREYYSSDGEWKPTSKAVNFPEEKLEQLEAAVLEAKEITKYPESQILTEIQKNSSDIVRVSLRTFKESSFLDIRMNYKKDDEYLPTKKGVTVPPDLIDDLLQGITLYKAFLNKEENK